MRVWTGEAANGNKSLAGATEELMTADAGWLRQAEDADGRLLSAKAGTQKDLLD